MELILLRHADTLQNSGKDINRALSVHGKKQANHLIHFFEDRTEFLPDLILCSTAIRARETIEPVIQNFNLKIEYLDRLYYTVIEDMVNLIERQNTKKLMIVSHNPTISRLANILYHGCINPLENISDIFFTPSQMIIFEVEDLVNLNGLKKFKVLYESI